MDRNFIKPKLSFSSIDRYYHRKAIYEAIEGELINFHGELMDAGCGKMPYREFILNNSKTQKYTGLDIEQALKYDSSVQPDFTWDGIIMPFENNSFDVVIATEVFEHCPDPDVIMAEIYRVLKPGGMVFFTVPFLWTLHETPHDYYRYTPFAIEKMLLDSSFKSINLKSMGGWHASMAQMLGLWVRRALGRKVIKNAFTLFMLPYYLILLKMDKKPIKFSNGQMHTGISGTAYKSI